MSPPPTKAQVKAQKRRDNKEERLRRQLPLINWCLQQGYTAIYTDGSSKYYDVIGWVGGFGVFLHTERPLSYSHPVHAECRQTNNGSELYAVYSVLTDVIPILELDKIVIITDSEYVFKGVLGGAAKWRRHGWRGASGPVANYWLWARVLALLECVQVDVKWLHVPLHVGIWGNEKASTLAESSRQLNKLCPFADKALHCSRVELDNQPGVVMVLDATPLPVSSPGFMFSPDTPEDSVAQGFQFSSGSGSSVRRRLNFGAAHGVSDAGVSPELPVENPMLADYTVEDETGEGGGR